MFLMIKMHQFRCIEYTMFSFFFFILFLSWVLSPWFAFFSLVNIYLYLFYFLFINIMFKVLLFLFHFDLWIWMTFFCFCDFFSMQLYCNGFLIFFCYIFIFLPFFVFFIKDVNWTLLIGHEYFFFVYFDILFCKP